MTGREESYPLLESINSPSDLKQLDEKQLNSLASEIRQYLIRQVTENGGHLASNLGVVELTIAIHRVFSTPHDHVIFDVGHQCYVHKLLTGRREEFHTLRQSGGISGFPKRTESEHDCFGTGHSSTSLSAALGFAEADRLNGSDAYTVCVFGDGAYTGGMIHEALNNCRKKLRLIIILNENEMSISKNIGRFAKSLSHLRASSGYLKTKSAVSRFLSRLPWIGSKLFRFLERRKQNLKTAVYGSNIFEDLGLFYLGPADGNNEAEVERLLLEAKKSNKSCIIHLKTKKGRGFAPAESTPSRFHGVSPADKPQSAGVTFSEAFASKLTTLAYHDESICAVTAAMADGTGLSRFRGAFPSRFFDVGIAEEHAVTFAAGLAANGMKPAVAIYSTFLQRSYDNIIHDVALQKLPVLFFIDRAGLNPSDGPTHAGVFDVAFLSEIPHLRIYTPATVAALENAIDEAIASRLPCAIRYPSGCEHEDTVAAFYGNAIPAGVGIRTDFLHTPSDSAEDLDALIVTHGRIVHEARKAEQKLAKQGRKVGIILLEQIKPYEEIAKQLLPMLPEKRIPILFLEEEIRTGGMGMLLSDALRTIGGLKSARVSILGLEDPFVTPKAGETYLHAAGLHSEAIARRIELEIGLDNQANV